MSLKTKPNPLPYPVELWPSRVQRKGVKAKEISPLMQARGTAGAWSEKDKTAHVDLAENGYARTVRAHESLHALYTPKGMSMAEGAVAQATEDARLHLNYAKFEGRQRRDELLVALLDLRTVATGTCDQDTAVLMTLRAMAIDRGGNVKSKWFKPMLSRALNALAKYPSLTKLGKAGVQFALNMGLDLLALEQIDQAKTALRPLFTPKGKAKEWQPKLLVVVVTHESGDGPESEPVDGKPMLTPAELAEKLDAHTQDPVKQELSTLDTSLLSNQTAASLQRDNGTGYPRMTTRKLYETVHRPTWEGESEKLATTGLRIKAKKLAMAAISPSPTKVFVKKAHRKGGTVLIDASGSMDLTDDMLKAITEALPMGTIAYYSGSKVWGNRSDPGHGDLVIYADQGRRFDATRVSGNLPNRYGSNAVDFPALQWLLRQPGPRYFIGDCQWNSCGQVYCDAASELVRNGKARGVLKHYTRVYQFFEDNHIPMPKCVEEQARVFRQLDEDLTTIFKLGRD